MNEKKTKDDYLQHGYQPTGEKDHLMGGYQPNGVSSTDANKDNQTPSNPPEGGSSQQDD